MPEPEDPPPWLAAATLTAMRAARDRGLAAGAPPRRVAEAVRQVALAHGPALPATMIGEAVALVVGHSREGRHPSRGHPAKGRKALGSQ